ncbi:MAG: hypothetical protein LAT75_02300 [Candidatus Cyclonatronum sp.]|uniref:hypothetical protein n=1 Tax=Cyclonatronum sp. TaxID=3024185 RepID=UPI0025B842C7|nr:hypothetical protein [Cyclonatronum sp.]MCC5934275.1 hypothetical protein [Balneolales bacterium]MCH8485666.1 hypothetical protein [Cyclonatronum sp.]
MLGPIIGKRKSHKRFEYKPRYYNESKERAKHAGHNIRFESKSSRGQVRSILLYAALLFGLFFVFLQLGA